METLPALQESSVEMLIAQAIDKSVPVETLERLLAMRKELKAEYAAEQFAVAMADFQSDCPIIKKTKSVPTKSGSVGYRYAPIESIVFQVRHLLKTHGLSYYVETVTAEKTVTAVCTARHILGHCHSSSFTVPLGGQTAMMNDSQVVAAALTFAKRYAFCNCFGIMTGDSDSDGRVEPIVAAVSKEQLEEMTLLLTSVNLPEAQLLKSFNVETLSELTKAQAIVFTEKLKAFIARTKGGESA